MLLTTLLSESESVSSPPLIWVPFGFSAFPRNFGGRGPRRSSKRCIAWDTYGITKSCARVGISTLFVQVRRIKIAESRRRRRRWRWKQTGERVSRGRGEVLALLVGPRIRDRSVE